MSYQFRSDISPKEFDAFVHQSAQNNLFQESSWAAIKNNWVSFLTGIFETLKSQSVSAVVKSPSPALTVLV